MIRTRLAPFVLASLLVPLAASADWPDLSRPASIAPLGEKDAAVIVGVENYVFAPAVPGAERNAADWYVYLARSRKIPPSKIRLLRGNEATLEAMEQQAHWAATAVEPGGVLWFIFIGHGAPARDGSDGVLVGVDAQQTVQSVYARSLPQKKLLEALAKGKQQRTIAVLDACFSGRGSDGAPLVPGVQPMIPVAPVQLANAVVLTAARSNQFAGGLPGDERPAFSYLLLGALRGWAAGSDEAVTVSEALSYVRESLQTVVTDRQQTPELWGSGGDFVLARNAREEGPDLTSLVLARTTAAEAPAKSEVAFNSVDVQVPKVEVSASGVTFASINLEAEKRLEVAIDRDESVDVAAAEKARAWCSLADLKERNPYREKAKDACRQWSDYAKKRAAVERSLAADYATVTGYVGLKHKSNEQRLAVIDAFLAAYGSLDDDERVRKVHSLRQEFDGTGTASGGKRSDSVKEPGATIELSKSGASDDARGQYLLTQAKQAYARREFVRARELLKQAQELGWNDLDLTAALSKEQ